MKERTVGTVRSNGEILPFSAQLFAGADRDLLHLALEVDALELKGNQLVDVEDVLAQKLQ